jgi:probable rRNA maturation factor
MTNAIPEIKVFVTREKGAPAQPTKAVLSAACLRALKLVPSQRCPEAFDADLISLDVTLINDVDMAEKNVEFMQHEGPTDVLSFPIVDFDHERGSFHLGDVLISFDTAKREAAERGISVAEEITRYCVHGFLHCLGYDDSTPAKRRSMFAVQEKAVLEG